MSEGGIPPAWWYQRCPTGADTPAAAEASIGSNPSAIPDQNLATTSRGNFGCPGERSLGLIARSAAC